MKQVLSDLLNRFLAETGLSVEDFVWGTLAVSLFFSTTHLASMVMTRWGDRATSGKALLFSIAVHVACIMGLFGVSLKVSQKIGKGDQTIIPVRKLVLDERDQEPVRGENDADAENRPIWDQFAPTLSPGNVRGAVGRREFVRSDLLSPDPMAIEAPERAAATIERPVPALPDLPRDSRMTLEVPKVEPAATDPQAGPANPAPRPAEDTSIAADNPVAAESRPEAGVPSAGPRGPGSRGGNRDGKGIEAPASEKPAFAGSNPAERVEKDRPPELLTSLSGAAGKGTPVPRAVPAPDAFDEQGTNPRPAPSTGDVDGAGTPGAEAATGTADGGTNVRRRVARKPGTDGIAPFEGVRNDRNPASPGSGVGTMRDRDPALPGLTANIGARGSVPGLERPDAAPFSVRGGGSSVPSTYRLRSLASRREVSRKYGGTEASEKAVENSLKWFASIQEADGSWDGDKYGAGQVKVDKDGVDRQYAGRDSDTGLSALVILSFLGAGYTPEEGLYAANVERGLKWLVAQQRNDGYFGGQATHYAQMYCHGMATYALAEACGMQNDPTADTLNLREPLRKAILYIIENQNSDGGWRYEKGQKSDMSMFGWQLMALKSAEIAGIRIPADVRSKMVTFLKDRSLGTNNGLAGYRVDSAASSAMTAEALFCKQMLGIARTNAQSREAVEYLLARVPRRTQMDEYYWYYGTLAMYQYGGPEWEQWNDSLRDLLVADQLDAGPHAGSWEPRGVWGRYGGRIYQTALSTLCLEVYYRFLPLYQLNEAPQGATP